MNDHRVFWIKKRCFVGAIKKFFVSNYKKILYITLPSFLIIALSYYIFNGLQSAHFHESAYSIAYAKNIMHHGLYSQTFAGREVALVTWGIILGIVSSFMGYGVLSHSISSFILLFFIVFILIIFKKYSKINSFSFCVLLILFFIVFTNEWPSRYSWLDQLWIWPMNSYGVYDFFSLIIMLFLYKIALSDEGILYKDSKRIIPISGYFLVCILSLISGLNGIRGLMVIGIPIICALFGNIVYELVNMNSLNIKTIKLFSFVSSSMFAGFLINRFMAIGSFQPTQNGHLNMSQGTFVDHLSTFINCWFNLFGAEVHESGINLISGVGMAIICKAIFAIILFYVTISFSIQHLNSKNVFYRVFIYKHLGVLGVLLISFLWSEGAYFARYLIPLAYSSFIIFSLYIHTAIKNSRFFLLLAVTLLLLVLPYFQTINGALSLNSSFFKLQSTNSVDRSLKEKPLYKLSQFLIKNNLKYGYASPWQADFLTLNLYSNDQVRIGLVDMPGFVRHWHSDDEWYSPVRGKTFFICQKSDYSTIAALTLLENHEIDIIAYDWYLIYIYDYNIGEIITDFRDKDNKFLQKYHDAPSFKTTKDVNVKSIKKLDDVKLISEKNFTGSEYDKPKYLNYYSKGSYSPNLGDKNTGFIEIEVAMDDEILIKTGPETYEQYFYIDGYRLNIPVCSDWTEFKFKVKGGGGSKLRIKIIDAGESYGQWTAILLNK
jgi:hypothetical protein